jgi:anti-sigma-K factor RskA
MAAPHSCDHYEDLLVDYVLRVLEPEAVPEVTEHLSTCDRCQAQWASYAAVLDQLAQAVPQHEPPAVLGARLRAAAVDGPGRLARRAPWWRRGAVLVTAANVVLCLGLGWWSWQVQRAAAAVQQRWQEGQRQLALQRQAFTLITAPETRSVVLRSDQPTSPARGVLLLAPAAPAALLIVQDLPPLPPARAYQVWFVGGERQRDNGGVFRVDAQGFGVLQLTAPQPFTAYQRVGITEEPAGGSPGPTSPRVIGAPLQGS